MIRKIWATSISILLSMLILTSAVTICASAALQYSDWSSVSISSYDSFRSSVIGKAYNVDGAHGAQCWDGACILWKKLGRNLVTRPEGNGSAYMCWTVSRDVNKGNDFDLIYNINDVQRGDVVVFNSSKNGHIAFADENYNGSGRLAILGQNQGNGRTPVYDSCGCYESAFNVTSMATSSFLGAFRLKSWAQPSKYMLDVNLNFDGQSYNSGLDDVTFDVYINGALAADDVTDFCFEYNAGTQYRITDIKTKGCKEYTEGEKSGTLNAATNVTLDVTTKHTPEEIPAVPATCTETGLTVGVRCSECGIILTEQEEIPALDHAFVRETLPPTCIEMQRVKESCSRCDYERTTIDPSLFGDWGEDLPLHAEVVETKTQYRSMIAEDEWKETESGTIEYAVSWPNGFDRNNWLFAQYNKTPVESTETENVKIEARTEQAGFIYWHWCMNSYAYGPINRTIKGAWSETHPGFHAFFSTEQKPVTESANAIRFDNAAVCKDTFWWERDPVIINRCIYTKYERVSDGWSEWSDWQDDEILENDTTKVESRTVYRAVVTRNGLYADHAWDNGKVSKAASCVAKGEKTFTCTVCGTTKTVKIAKDAKKHTGGTEIRNSKAATCGTDGYTGDTFCKGCGVKISSGKTIPATGEHTWNSGKITKAATCTANGVKTYTCTVCKTTKTGRVAKSAHKLNKTEAKAPTCTADGNVEYYTCSVCKKTFSDAKGSKEIKEVSVKATGHSFGKWKITKEATATEDGIETRKCSNCGKKENRPIAKHEINYKPGDVSEDGRILANDARLALRYSAKLEMLSESQILAADVNGNGQVLADDARQILRFSANLQKTFAKAV